MTSGPWLKVGDELPPAELEAPGIPNPQCHGAGSLLSFIDVSSIS